MKVAAAALAKRVDMNFADLDDLRLVMDQAMVVLLDGLEPDRNQDRHIDVFFRIVDDRLEFEASRNTRTGPTGEPLTGNTVSLFTQITRGLLDELRIDPNSGAIWLSKARSGIR